MGPAAFDSFINLVEKGDTNVDTSLPQIKPDSVANTVTWIKKLQYILTLKFQLTVKIQLQSNLKSVFSSVLHYRHYTFSHYKAGSYYIMFSLSIIYSVLAK